MNKEYPEWLKKWKDSHAWEKERSDTKPLPMQPADSFLTKMSLYFDKFNLSNEVDYATRIYVPRNNLYRSIKVILTTYVLNREGMLIELVSENGNPPDRIDYKVSYDISKVLLRESDKTVWVYTKRKWDDPLQIRFETEAAASSFFDKLNHYKNYRPNPNKGSNR